MEVGPVEANAVGQGMHNRTWGTYDMGLEAWRAPVSSAQNRTEQNRRVGAFQLPLALGRFPRRPVDALVGYHGVASNPGRPHRLQKLPEAKAAFPCDETSVVRIPAQHPYLKSDTNT